MILVTLSLMVRNSSFLAKFFLIRKPIWCSFPVVGYVRQAALWMPHLSFRPHWDLWHPTYIFQFLTQYSQITFLCKNLNTTLPRSDSKDNLTAPKFLVPPGLEWVWRLLWAFAPLLLGIGDPTAVSNMIWEELTILHQGGHSCPGEMFWCHLIQYTRRSPIYCTLTLAITRWGCDLL